MRPEWNVELLGPQHDRSLFRSGSDVMDRYLREQAGQDLKRGLAVPYVLVDPGVIGYYTLSAMSIPLSDWPAAVSKKLPRYPQLPATLLGRLAVHQEARRLRCGEYLLMDACCRALEASDRVASYALVVDVLDLEPDPLGFYLRYGFQAFPDHPRRLFLTMQTIRQSLQP